MSNPAVIKLQKKKIGKMSIWMDDNFGEAIHLHIDSFRIDLTNNDFSHLCDDICETYNKYVNTINFDSKNLNPIYIEQMLWEDICNIERVVYDKVKLSDLLCPSSNGELKHVYESRGVKALDGDTLENDEYRSSHHIGQNSKNRLDDVYYSIKEYGYPHNNEYIIVYNDDNVIRDGQHRASCLWKLYGDIEIDVMRIYLKNYKVPNIKYKFGCINRIKKSLYVTYHKVVTILLNPSLIKKFCICVKKAIKRALCAEDYEYLLNILENK